MLAIARAEEGRLSAAAASKRHSSHGLADRGTPHRTISGIDVVEKAADGVASEPVRTSPVAAATKPAETTHFAEDAGIELSVITSLAGLEALEPEWNSLFAACGRDIHVFQTFNWIWHWTCHFLPARRDADADCGLFIVTARRNGRLVLVCPFVRQRRAGLTTLGFAGDPVSQYGDALLDEAHGGRAALARAWTFVMERSGADAFSFRKVRGDSNIASFLADTGCFVTERDIAPYLDLTSAPDYQTYEKRYSTKARKNRRRLLKRLGEYGLTSMMCLTSGARAGELAALAITLKQAWLKHRGLFSRALAHPTTRAFFVAVARGGERPIGTVVKCLETGGETAAIEISFDCKGRRAVHVIVYALKFERASAGQLLMERSVRDAMEEGIGVFDLMAPGDAYKLDWADASVEVLDWAKGLTMRGRIFTKLYLGHTRPKLKIAINATGELMRRVRAGRESANHTS